MPVSSDLGSTSLPKISIRLNVITSISEFVGLREKEENFENVVYQILTDSSDNVST